MKYAAYANANAAEMAPSQLGKGVGLEGQGMEFGQGQRARGKRVIITLYRLP